MKATAPDSITSGRTSNSAPSMFISSRSTGVSDSKRYFESETHSTVLDSPWAYKPVESKFLNNSIVPSCRATALGIILIFLEDENLCSKTFANSCIGSNIVSLESNWLIIISLELPRYPPIIRTLLCEFRPHPEYILAPLLYLRNRDNWESSESGIASLRAESVKKLNKILAKRLLRSLNLETALFARITNSP